MPNARGWVWLLITIVVIAAGYGGWQHVQGAPSASQRPGQSPAPVHVAMVERKDFPVVLNGLGTVQPTNTVTVRSRVDGQIEKVAFEEGQMVHEGDLLVQIDPAPFQAALDQATAKLTQDQASLNNAKQDLGRTSTLARQGDATQQLLDQRTANVASLAAQVQADQASIESAKVQLAYTTIRSPLTGRAGFRLVDPGNIVHASDQNGLVVITQLQPIAVVFTIPEDSLPPVLEKLNSGVKLLVDAWDREQKQRLASGTLLTVDNQIDPTTGTVRLKAVFPNTDGRLFPSQFVNAHLRLEVKRGATVVPTAAIQQSAQGTFVYVVKSDHSATVRPVKVGVTEGDNAAIDSGVSPGEMVVVDGGDRLREGIQVALQGAGGGAPVARRGP
jgi:membrane fusion protein, multidrug efflux system